MPAIDAYIFDKKGVKNNLILELEEGDSIMECIKKGMQEHGLNKVSVEAVDGVLKEGLINYFEGGYFKSSVLKNASLMLASGGFTLNYGELFGSMKIVTGDKPPMHGTFVRGIAKEGMKLTLSFIQLVEKDNGKGSGQG